jgi:hypothetical protein
VSPVRYVLGFYISEDAILHSHRRENRKSYEGMSVPIRNDWSIASRIRRMGWKYNSTIDLTTGVQLHVSAVLPRKQSLLPGDTSGGLDAVK